MSGTLDRPPKAAKIFDRVAILFSGGPAPAANAVISTAAASFLNNDIEAVGILHGYSNLEEYTPEKPLVQGEHYVLLDERFLKRTRNAQGIMIGTDRANPGRDVSSKEHLKDKEKTAPLRRVYEGLVSLGVNALVSIGGDDTLKTANKFMLFQEGLPESAPRIPVVHLPKTIDNDYCGIDFTFGYFTAVEFLASELRNLLFDAEATRCYYLAETMGRSAGWLAYGAAIAGEASLVISVEDITGPYATLEDYEDPQTKVMTKRRIMNLEKVVDRIVKTMLVRESENKQSGVVVLAEGLAELLPAEHLKGIPRDAHGHIAIAKVGLGKKFSKWISDAYTEATRVDKNDKNDKGKKRKVVGVQLGYEARCAKPHAFDVMLGSQLGVGAYRALVERRLNGVMVSTVGQLDLTFVPFERLVDPENLVTKVRHIEVNSDFHSLARFLETSVFEEESKDALDG